ncbi:MAG: Ig-like domain-containing protein [Gemmatimonadota bacterium]|nr:Ig-like domain-containing protein [Gemmatimonadota bacterium]
MRMTGPARRRAAMLFPFLSFAALVLACGDSADPPSGPGPVPAGPAAPTGPTPDDPDSTAPGEPETPTQTLAIELQPADTLIDPGASARLRVDVIGGDPARPPDLAWTSRDTAVALVGPDGMVTGIDAGSATIVARAGAAADSVRIDVRLRLASVSVGEMHACGLSERGAVFCWGANPHGELGTGDYGSRLRPARTAPGLRLAEVAAAGGFTCGAAPDGTGWCWGDGSMMEMGTLAAAKTNPLPLPVDGGHVFRSVSGSQMAHACGLGADGGARCWGYNRFGMVGHGVTRDEPTPVPVAGGHVFRALHSAFFRTCGIDDEGRALCWGRGGPAQIGDPAAVPDTCSGLPCALSPRPAASSAALAEIAVGQRHTCALGSDGLVLCWGDNEAGQAGQPAGADVPVPTPLELPAPAVAVAAGAAHACALLSDGPAHCWGDNSHGQLGDGSRAGGAPRAVAGGLRFVFLAAGYDQTCGITEDGGTWCWGRNSAGQLARDPAAVASSEVPVRVAMH